MTRTTVQHGLRGAGMLALAVAVEEAAMARRDGAAWGPVRLRVWWLGSGWRKATAVVRRAEARVQTMVGRCGSTHRGAAGLVQGWGTRAHEERHRRGILRRRRSTRGGATRSGGGDVGMRGT